MGLLPDQGGQHLQYGPIMVPFLSGAFNVRRVYDSPCTALPALIQLRQLHRIFAGLADPTINSIGYDEGLVGALLVAIQSFDVRQRLGVLLANPPPAETARPVRRSIAVPTVHCSSS
jgi:hypothetical protein